MLSRPAPRAKRVVADSLGRDAEVGEEGEVAEGWRAAVLERRMSRTSSVGGCVRGLEVVGELRAHLVSGSRR